MCLAEDRTHNRAGMAMESGQELAAVGLPEPRGAVVRGGEHPAAVRTEDRAPNRATMALENGQKLAAVNLPEPCSTILRGGEPFTPRRVANSRASQG